MSTEPKKPKTIPMLYVSVDGKTGWTKRADYVRERVRTLREFGYPTLTHEEVEEQVKAVLEKKTFRAGLTVIGMILQKEVLKEAEIAP